MKPLYERFRPSCWSEVIGQGKAVATCQRMAGAGEVGGQAFWISGKSGTGKTTIARLLAAEIADPFFVEELDASEVTLAYIREWERTRCLYAMGRGGRALIINEAHGLKKDVLRRLLVSLEPIPSHTVVIFTTTLDGQGALFDEQIDAGPLLSRCICISLAQRGLAQAFAEHLKAGATEVELDGQPIEKYVRMVNENQANLRACWQHVQAGEMKG